MSDVQCEQHGGAIKNAEGVWVCCKQEEFSIDSYEGKSTEPASKPPPAAVRLIELAFPTRVKEGK